MKDLFRFEESDDPLVEDDAWVLKANENISIQVCQDGTFGISKFVEEEGCFYHRYNYKHLSHAMQKALSFLNNMDQEHLFGAFQATRQYKKDSEPYHGDYVMEGYTYLNTYEHFLTEGLHVEITNGAWKTDGKYGVTIDRSSLTSDNLEELERHVFKFAMEEGYADIIREISSDA